jgi:hypothetical protein
MYWATTPRERRAAGWPWYTALLVVTVLACAVILLQPSWQQTRQNRSTTQATPTPLSATRPPHSPLGGGPLVTRRQPSAHPVAHPPVPPSCCTSAAVFCRVWVSSCSHTPAAASCCPGSCGSRWGKLLLVLWRERVANPSKRGLAVGNAPLGSIALQAAHWLVEMSMEREAVLGHLRLCSCPFGDMLSLFL